MEDTNKSVGSCNSYEHSKVPRCGCYRLMKMWFANTVKNRNRRFLKCRNAGVVNSCDLFIWDDEISHFISEISNFKSYCKHCDVTKLKFELTKRKLEKSKLKIVALKRKNFQLNVEILMSWFIFAVLYNYL
ncbi:unnamed protein product [Vicia faba]|uniref:Zinc finger GRF-type domain-containing protein n=1 Tax=Vicia faba TaxID=3906 RepID=A0AAV1ADY3_VICFA|nr:unnamed protein product [Vicia faba]